MKKILHITPDFNYTCGRSKLVYLYLKYFGSKKEYETHFVTNGGDSLERLKEFPAVKLKIFPFSSGIKNIFYQKKFYTLLKNYIIKNGIEIIHTHHRFPELVSVKIGRELKIKTITSANSFVSGYKKISFGSDKIISVSNSVTSHLVNNFNIDKKKLFTLYNPVEEPPEIKYQEIDRIKRESGISPDQKLLLFVGRINYLKGYDKLIQAYQAIRKKNNDVLLIMCGKIEDKKFAKLRTKLTVPVFVIPPLTNLNPLYRMSNVVVLPSRIDSFPFVMIEAGSYKKPFIGSRINGISEIIDDGVDGLLVEQENENDLIDKILFLLDNKKEADKFGNNLYAKVKEKCSYEKYFSKVEKIYDTLLIK